MSRVAGLSDVLHAKLASVGLVEPRASSNLGSFLDGYFAMRTDVKPATLIVWDQTRRNLIEFFGADKPLRRITPGDAEEWRLHLIREELSDATIRKRSGFAKQFFAFAVRKKLIEANPFADLKSAAVGNPERFRFVTPQEAAAVLAACPDAEWRLIVALARFGGLRCPSEHYALKWPDIDWERNRMTVTSPKTEHHEGKGSRVVPIFPELRPHLEGAFDSAEPGTVHVIARHRNANLRTRFEKIIKRAGLTPWPACSRTCAARGRRNWKNGSRRTSSAGGWGIARRWPIGITFRRPRTTSPGRCKAAQKPAHLWRIFRRSRRRRPLARLRVRKSKPRLSPGLCLAVRRPAGLCTIQMLRIGGSNP
jgi:integrase